MKQYFSLKSIFWGTALLVSGTVGLISNANAHDSHRYDRDDAHYYQHKYRYGYDRDSYRAKRAERRYYKQRYYDGYRKHREVRRHHKYGYWHNNDNGSDSYYDQGFSQPQRNKKHCYNFRVKAIGGLGGFRFQHNIKNFKRFKNGGYSGKICGRRHVEFELSKVQPGVKVVLKIDGKRFVYGAHSGHDRYINTWHRKYYSVRLGH